MPKDQLWYNVRRLCQISVRLAGKEYSLVYNMLVRGVCRNKKSEDVKTYCMAQRYPWTSQDSMLKGYSHGVDRRHSRYEVECECYQWFKMERLC